MTLVLDKFLQLLRILSCFYEAIAVNISGYEGKKYFCWIIFAFIRMGGGGGAEFS